MKNTILILITVLIAVSCNTVKRDQRRQNRCTAWGICKTVSDSTVITKKDTVWLQATPVVVESDSGYFMAYLECNEENNVIMSQYRTINGKYIALQNKLENGQLFVTASTPKRIDTVYVPYYKTVEKSVNKVVGEKITNKLTGLQSFLIGCGIGVWILFILFLIYRLIRWIIKKYTGGAFTFFNRKH